MRAPKTIEIRRHYRLATERETQELVEAMAELFVNFIKGGSHSGHPQDETQERNHERDREKPESR
jgi:hypothetical protein